MYSPVDKNLDFVAIEKRILEFWRERRIFARIREQNAGGEVWSFQDGPITANNPMGVHHAWGRSLKDCYQRYHAMQGRALRYQNGFDCQGLWVEVEIEKERGFRSKRDIHAYGLARFVRECKERVLTFAARQTEQSIRLGYWMDWDDPEALRRLRDALHDEVGDYRYETTAGGVVVDTPEAIVSRLGSAEFGGSYFTFSSENNYTIWHFLKRCHDEGHIYRGTDVMPWCPRCGTGLSQMEVAEGRRIVAHTSVFVRFPLRERPGEAFLVWTTTPWTLTSNVAVAVNPELPYLKVRQGDWSYWVGKGNFAHKRQFELEAEGHKRAVKLPSLEQILRGLGGEVTILDEVPGSELLGLTYQGPFDALPAALATGGITPFGPVAGVSANAVDSHRAIAWKEISATEGTGIVHIAPGCGTEDYLLGRENGLAVIAPLDENGVFLEGFGPFTGVEVAAVSAQVVADLKGRGLLLAREEYTHVYPHCWRCKTELVFRLIDGWYIDMSWRDRIQKVVGDIRWIPADGEARERDWLRNMGDWLISKKRFWGLALPIWECTCGWFTVIGGEEELKSRAISGWEAFAGHSPHRPYVDAVRIACEKCGGEARRVEDVGNPWLDAGIVPFSTLRYREDRDYWRRHFPADMVIECFPGQFRNWFYSLLAMSVKLEGRAPFKTLLGHALVRDERGDEMHKSSGNAISFDAAADLLGADVMRYLYASQNPAVNLNFPDLRHEEGKGGVHPDTEVRRKLLTFWNCYSFFVSYARIDQWRPGPEDPPVAGRSELDRWILSRLQLLIAQAHEAFAGFAVHRLMEHFEHFVDDLSNWYLRRSRRRFWGEGVSDDKRAAFATLYESLVTCLRLVAPVMPFLTEEIWANLVVSVDPEAPESVHLGRYPVADGAVRDVALEERVAAVLRIKNAALKLRNQCQIKIRQPLGRLLVLPRDDNEREVLGDPSMVAQILEECNVKGLELLASGEGVRVGAKPNFKTLGARAGKSMKAVAAKIVATEALALQERLARDKRWMLPLDDGTELEILPADVQFTFDAGPGREVCREAGSLVILETTISPELAAEGMVRDFNRLAQNLRRDSGLELSDRVRILFDADQVAVEAIREHREHLARELLADGIDHKPGLDGAEFKLGAGVLRLKLERS
ncbi:MAG: class I tRNA ligase family protein [Magnetococcales bacterium]|nr:class I tRNA ligase family protein [Magnetococcales bacterium]